ncbi:carboxypeptidase [Rhizobium sp. CSW-27]|uniref:S10 family peptidase n=1 Tax=Rhizobium sp. CSW-27 TaxID=2839985 RepID=UPI001C03940C|nr:carboxypeptidase [Rhizobium sp. CSW-27]MBT9372290.1 carboxypeptidase [Rhizobium sp. CSW-27]
MRLAPSLALLGACLVAVPVAAPCLFAPPALAQQAGGGGAGGDEHAGGPDHPQRSGGSERSGGLLDLLPADAVSAHVLETPTGPLPYSATAGTLALRGQDGKVTAKIFYTAYRAKDRTPGRPVTFAFNGGPGAASAYLHLGLVGPKILPFSGDNADGSRPVLRDNPESWLAFSDLVLIDPVGTGWSRALSDEAAGRFYSVRQDAESLAKAIALYVRDNADLLPAPKYLLGESYGGFRAAKVALAMKNSQGLIPSGIVMISPLMEGRFVFGNDNDPLAAALQFPALAAAELERQGRFDREKVGEAERFAMTDYLATLAGPWPQGEAAAAFYRTIAGWTGLSEQAIAPTRGFVGDLYAKQAGGPGRILSPYDAGETHVDAYPESVFVRNDDPVLEGYTRAYAAAFSAYARDSLGFRTEMTYTLLNEEVNRRWEWNGGRGGDSRVTASIATDLRDLLSTIPSFRLMVAHGYSDILTPFGASRYVLNHLPPTLGEGRTQLNLYRGGHMFYTRDDDRRQIFQDAQAFYR